MDSLFLFITYNLQDVLISFKFNLLGMTDPDNQYQLMTGHDHAALNAPNQSSRTENGDYSYKADF